MVIWTGLGVVFPVIWVIVWYGALAVMSLFGASFMWPSPAQQLLALFCVVLANAFFASDAVNNRLPYSWAKSHSLFFIPMKIWTFILLAVWVYGFVIASTR